MSLGCSAWCFLRSRRYATMTQRRRQVGRSNANHADRADRSHQSPLYLSERARILVRRRNRHRPAHLAGAGACLRRPDRHRLGLQPSRSRAHRHRRASAPAPPRPRPARSRRSLEFHVSPDPLVRPQGRGHVGHRRGRDGLLGPARQSPRQECRLPAGSRTRRRSRLCQRSALESRSRCPRRRSATACRQRFPPRQDAPRHERGGGHRRRDRRPKSGRPRHRCHRRRLHALLASGRAPHGQGPRGAERLLVRGTLRTGRHRQLRRPPSADHRSHRRRGKRIRRPGLPRAAPRRRGRYRATRRLSRRRYRRNVSRRQAGAGVRRAGRHPHLERRRRPDRQCPCHRIPLERPDRRSRPNRQPLHRRPAGRADRRARWPARHSRSPRDSASS